MSEPFVAEIRICAFNFAPVGWAFCAGQILPISQNTALFSLLGTNYGGNGQSNFGLPNLQGKAAIGQGQGPGLTDRFLGEEGGSSSVTLLQTEMPSHTHNFQVRPTGAIPPSSTPAGQAYARSNSRPYDPGTTVGGQMGPTALSVAGGSLPHNNMMPYMGLNFIIALQGIFPPRP